MIITYFQDVVIISEHWSKPMERMVKIGCLGLVFIYCSGWER